MGNPKIDPGLLFERARALRAPFMAHLRRSFIHLATGGEWAAGLPDATRRNLVWFWLDGLFASASDNIVGTYLVVFLLALGASQGQIGLLSALSSLSAALMLMPGALLVERIGRRRGIVLAGGGWARAALLLLALAPLILSGPQLIWFAIALAVSRDALGNLSFPAWMSLTADIVPMAGRGRYFASRNFIMAITGMSATFLIGLLITHLSGTTGYQAALLIAFIIGAMSIFSFSRIAESQPQTAEPPRMNPSSADPAPASLAPDSPETCWQSEEDGKRPARLAVLSRLSGLLSHREFVLFAGVTALWNLSLNIAGPFFNVYLVKNLAANPTMVGLTSIASSVAGMLAQTRLGVLYDRWGARRMVAVSGLLIPVIPLAWIWINSAWYVIPINLVSGALWGAYNMGSFNYLLQITPPERRARYSAIFQIVVTLSLAAGAALGSLVLARWGFPGVFGGSGAGRMIAALLFIYLTARLTRP